MFWHMWLWYKYTSTWFANILRSLTLLLPNIEDISIWIRNISGQIALHWWILPNITKYINMKYTFLTLLILLNADISISKIPNIAWYEIYLDQLPYIAKQIECWNINMQNILALYCWYMKYTWTNCLIATNSADKPAVESHLGPPESS